MQHGQHERLQRYNGANGAADPTIAAIQDVMEAERAKGNDPIRRTTGAVYPHGDRPVNSIEDARTPGERIRKLLAMSDTTFEEFAELSGIPKSSLSSICAARCGSRGAPAHRCGPAGRKRGFYHVRHGSACSGPHGRRHAQPCYHGAGACGAAAFGELPDRRNGPPHGPAPARIQRAILAFVRTLADSALDGDLE